MMIVTPTGEETPSVTPYGAPSPSWRDARGYCVFETLFIRPTNPNLKL